MKILLLKILRIANAYSGMNVRSPICTKIDIPLLKRTDDTPCTDYNDVASIFAYTFAGAFAIQPTFFSPNFSTERNLKSIASLQFVLN